MLWLFFILIYVFLDLYHVFGYVCFVLANEVCCCGIIIVGDAIIVDKILIKNTD